MEFNISFIANIKCEAIDNKLQKNFDIRLYARQQNWGRATIAVAIVVTIIAKATVVYFDDA